jgi:hypothetical protein
MPNEFVAINASTTSFVVGSHVARTVVLRCEAEPTVDPPRQLLPPENTAIVLTVSAHYVSYLFIFDVTRTCNINVLSFHPIFAQHVA